MSSPTTHAAQSRDSRRLKGQTGQKTLFSGSGQLLDLASYDLHSPRRRSFIATIPAAPPALHIYPSTSRPRPAGTSTRWTRRSPIRPPSRASRRTRPRSKEYACPKSAGLAWPGLARTGSCREKTRRLSLSDLALTSRPQLALPSPPGPVDALCAVPMGRHRRRPAPLLPAHLFCSGMVYRFVCLSPLPVRP